MSLAIEARLRILEERVRALEQWRVENRAPAPQPNPPPPAGRNTRRGARKTNRNRTSK